MRTIGFAPKLAGTRRARNDHRGRAIVDSRSIAGRDRAVLLERGLEGAQDFDGGVFARTFVFFEDHGRRALLLCGQFDGHDLRLEAALFHGRERFPVRVHSELVLLLARDAVLLRNVLAGDPHVIVVVNVPQAVVHHGIDDGGVAQPVSFARLRKKVGRVRHRLHAARDDDGTVLGLNCLRRESDGFQSGAADLVDCHGTCLRGQSAEDGSLSSGVLTQSCADHVAHNALVHLLRIEIRALHSFANNDRA